MSKFVGELRMIENAILPSGMHRAKFQCDGGLPDLEECKERCKAPDDIYVFQLAWMDPKGIGHAVLAWKEYQQINLDLTTKGDHDEDRN